MHCSVHYRRNNLSFEYFLMHAAVGVFMLKRIFLIYIAFIYLTLLLLATTVSAYAWRITIEKAKGDSALHIAEVNFYLKNHLLDKANFKFTATSYINSINIGHTGISGPPQAANDGSKDTFFHSGFDDGHRGYTGNCCPDLTPTLTITTSNDSIRFDQIKIINRQDKDGNDKYFFDRLIGTVCNNLCFYVIISMYHLSTYLPVHVCIYVCIYVCMYVCTHY